MTERKVKNVILRHRGRKYPYITVIFDDESSKSITVRADLKTAEKLLFKIKRQIAIGTFDIDDFVADRQKSGVTLGQFRDRFIEHRGKLVHIDHLKEATLVHDKLSLNLLCERLGDDISMSDVTTETAINFIISLKDSMAKNGKPFKPGAINSYLRNIKTAFYWAVHEKIIKANPWKGISRLPDPNDRQFRYLCEDDIAKIREYLQTKPEWQLDIFNLCLWTGARRGEVFNITVRDLYVDDIRGEKVPFVRLSGKGRKTRNMPLCAEACQLLDRRVSYLRDNNKQFEIIDVSKSPTMDLAVMMSRLKQGYLFWEIIHNGSITKAFGRVRKALKLSYFNVHSLRHSFATYCLKDDVPITTVKEFLGHNNISTTMIYAKTDDELKASDIKKVKAR